MLFEMSESKKMCRTWRLGRDIVLAFVCALALNCSQYQAVSADENHSSETHSTGDKIVAHIRELDALFDKYRALAEDTDNVILGLNRLGVFYLNLTDELRRTKSLIGEISTEYAALQDENQKLKRIINLDKDQIDAILEEIQTKDKWSNRWEALLINLFAAFIFGIIGDRIYIKLRIKNP